MECEYMSVKEVCQKLGVSRQTIAKAIKSGKIEAAKIGKQYRIKRSWLEDFLNNGGNK